MIRDIDQFICQGLRAEPLPWNALPQAVSALAFLQRCEHHRVQSLLYHRAHRSANWASWPGDVRQSLERSSKASIAHDALRNHVLVKILDDFSRRDIPALLMKGEALARTHYPDPGSRIRCDSDLFIRISDVAVARQAVLDMGLIIVSPTFKSHQFTVRRGDGSDHTIEIDVHWRVLNAAKFARTLSFGEAYAGALPAPGLSQVRLLGDIDALLVACMHRWGSDRHDRERLIWLYDIHLLVSGMRPHELQAFAVKAVQRSVQQSCSEGLERSRQCFNTQIPADVMDQLATPAPARTFPVRFSQSNLGLLLDDWRRLPGMSARMSLLQELFLPSAESLERKYGRSRKLMLPIQYARHFLSGLLARLTLK